MFVTLVFTLIQNKPALLIIMYLLKSYVLCVVELMESNVVINSIMIITYIFHYPSQPLILLNCSEDGECDNNVLDKYNLESTV